MQFPSSLTLMNIENQNRSIFEFQVEYPSNKKILSTVLSFVWANILHFTFYYDKWIEYLLFDQTYSCFAVQRW